MLSFDILRRCVLVAAMAFLIVPASSTPYRGNEGDAIFLPEKVIEFRGVAQKSQGRYGIYTLVLRGELSVRTLNELTEEELTSGWFRYHGLIAARKFIVHFNERQTQDGKAVTSEAKPGPIFLTRNIRIKLKFKNAIPLIDSALNIEGIAVDEVHVYEVNGGDPLPEDWPNTPD